MKFSKILGLTGAFAAVALSFSSCKKDWLDVKPTDQITDEDAFSTVQGARAVLNGIHRTMFESTDHNTFGMSAIGLMYDLMGDDMGINGQGSGWFVTAGRYNDARGPQSTGSYQWSFYYRIINNANWIISQINDVPGSQEEKDEIKGQALAYRAWAYYQLVSCYNFNYKNDKFVVAQDGQRTGVIDNATPRTALGVPLYTAPSKEASPRATLEENYVQMRADIKEAMRLLENTTITYVSDKSQITYEAAAGIAARIALAEQDWTTAANMAKIARQKASLASGASLLDGFGKSSNIEWIWGSIINNEQNGIYASFLSHMDFNLNAYGNRAQKLFSRNLVNGSRDSATNYMYGVKATDTRSKWYVAWGSTTPGVPQKSGQARGLQQKIYAPTAGSFAGDYPLMRVAEMYLTEAEALAQQGNIAEATTLLQEYMVTRDPAYVVRGTSKDALVHEIWNQRRVELWGEGFRYHDLKRQMAKFSGVTPISSMDKTGAGFNTIGFSGATTIEANDARMNFRIPGGEINYNPACQQNP